MGAAVHANLLLNGGFESPIGSEWTTNILSGSLPWSLGASTTIVHSGTYSYGMAYGPGDPTGHAYVQQVLTGLTPGESYTITGWIYMDWRATKAWAYIEALGGGSPVSAPAIRANQDDVWVQYSLSQTANSSGNLTVRLHLNKDQTTASGDKTAIAYFDDIVVEPVPEPATVPLGLACGLGLLLAMQQFRRR